MHLFTEYALSTGSKIKRPKLLEKFYPLSSQKYITIQTGSGMGAKNYDYFQEAIELLKPTLEKYKIDLIQLGLKDEPQILGAINLCGLTNLGQSTYIINRGLLHVGTDSSLVHIASSLDKPIVAVYGISPVTVCGPYFNSKSRTICLEPEFSAGQKFSYNPNEQPKMVNTIKPEKVAAAILELFGSSEKLNHESIFFGKDYKNSIIEVIPDQIIHPQNFPNILLNIRADLLFNEDAIYGNASQRPVVIVTKQPLNIDILKQLKQNIKNIYYILEIENKERDLEFISRLHDSGISYVLITNDKNNLNDLKFTFLDYNQILHFALNTKEKINSPEKLLGAYFKTNKFMLSDGKIYLSRAHWEQKKPYDPQKKNEIIDHENFWHDVDYFYIYRNL